MAQPLQKKIGPYAYANLRNNYVQQSLHNRPQVVTEWSLLQQTCPPEISTPQIVCLAADGT